MVEWLEHLWPVIAAALLLAAAGVTMLPQRSLWAPAAVVVATCSGLLVGTMLHAEMGTPGVLVLARDIVAGSFMCFVIPALQAWFLRSRRDDARLIRLAGSLGIGLGLLPPVPVVILFVHCTSGDCL
jgi:hypothetical protein